MSAAPGRDAARRRLGDLGLVAVLISPALWVVTQSWFYYDDFYHLQVVDRSPFGWDALTRNIFGHVMPGLVVAFEAVSLAGTASWLVAAFLMIGGFAACLALTVAIGRRLGLARPIPELAAVAVAVNGSWPSTLSWFSASINVLGSTLGSLGAVWFLLASIRRPGWPAAVGVGASVALALSAFEASVLTVPLLVAIVVFVALAQGGSVGSALRRQWRVGVALGAVLGGAAVVWIAAGLSGSDGGVALPTAAWVGVRGVLDGAVPAQVGIRPPEAGWSGAGWLLVAASVLVLAGATWWWARRVGRHWWVLAGPVLAVGLLRGTALGASRFDELGWQISTVNRQVAIGAWMVPVIAMVGLAWGRSGSGATPVEGTPNSRDLATARGRLVALSAIAIGLMLASIPAAWAEGPAFRSREYRDRFVSSLNRQATSNRGDVTVADTTVPHVVIGPQFGSGTHLSVTLGLAGVTASWNQPGVDLLLADDTGRLGPATWGRYTSGDLSNIFVSTGSGTVEASPGGGTCVRAGPDGTLAWIPLNRRLTPAEWTLRLDLVDAVDPAPRLAVAGVEAPRYIADEVIDRWPDGEVLITGEPFTADRVGLALAPGSSVCLRSLHLELAEATDG
ncbi:MAG: hypothetical protein WBK25_13290 [Candidatus Microthrix parvicella]